ncbi:MAG: 5'/3'-nucleotidase SurE [Campylobacterales bacterium]
MGERVILVTNDDGYQAEGLHHLIEAVKPLGEVWVVAPANPKSACGHSLTLTNPLKLIEVGERFFKVEDGTPTDCIFIALAHLFKERKPDLIVSGINYGANMGEDVTYSGTVGGAMEGSIHQIPSIAFSQVITSFEEEGRGIDWGQSREVAFQISRGVLEGRIPIPDRQILNVNIPNVREIKGYQVTRGGYRLYRNEVVLNRNPRGELYFWIGLHPLNFREEEGTDFWAIKNGFVSITPLKLDLTATETIPPLRAQLKELF